MTTLPFSGLLNNMSVIFVALVNILYTLCVIGPHYCKGDVKRKGYNEYLKG